MSEDKCPRCGGEGCSWCSTATDGLALGHAAAQRAADHAGDDWKEEAYAAFCAFLATVPPGQTFLTEDARAASPHIPRPPEMRAWGQVALRAKRAGKIVHCGYARAKDPSVHGNPVSLWRRA